MSDEQEFVMNMGAIINATRVVAYYNKPLERLVSAFEQHKDVPANIKTSVENAHRLGDSIFEAITRCSPSMADAIHDFVYEIAYPHGSMVTKSIAREQVSRTVMGLV